MDTHVIDLDSARTGRVTRGALVLLLSAMVASCGTTGGRAIPVQETAPSVSYDYTGDEGLIDATFQAEAYCRQFNSWPTTTSMDVASGGGSTVTFVCDQTRATAYTGTQPPPLPANPTVSYSYRNDQGLIDATNQAQRHCADFGAHARSYTVTTGADGGRTVVFECVH